jgi:adenylate cyclase
MIPSVLELNATDFESLGVYDPDAPLAAERLALLEYLVGLGATADDLVQYRDQLPGLALVVAIRGGRALNLSEAAQRVNIPGEKLLRITRAAGFPEPGGDDQLISEELAELAAAMTAVEAVFGEEAVIQLVRVMGSAMSRLADAMVSAFLVNVEPGVRGEDSVGLAVARANVEAVALIPTANVALDILLRQHIIAARRTVLGDPGEAGYETRRLCVGFVDLVGSTALALRLSTRELGALLTEFEEAAADAIASAGGRVVKLIGDEVLFTAADESSACGIALTVAAALREHPTVPQTRVGLAAGLLLLRDGDVFGPVVSLAARAVKLAAPGDVVMPAALAAAAGVEATPLGVHQLAGFDEDVELCRLTPS